MKIFAYGSNMNQNRLKDRVPSATKVMNAELRDYRLVFNKISNDGSAKANIEAHEGGVVWGVIFEIDDSEKSSLDRAEGLGYGYDEKIFPLHVEDGTQHYVRAYIASENKYLDANLKPYDWYYEMVKTGAINNNLPEEYLDQLTAVEFVRDADEMRRKEKLKIVNTRINI